MTTPDQTLQTTSYRPPTQAKAIKENGTFTVDWQRYFNQLYIMMSANFVNNMPVDPSFTTDEINGIPVPLNGMRLYNSTLNKFVGYENGAWVQFSSSPM